MISEQPELNVPTTPMTSLSLAYELAFCEHLAESHLPACAVESSQSWKPTVYAPAFQPAPLRMNCSACTIWFDCDRCAPWRGRSEAMMNFGVPAPL